MDVDEVAETDLARRPSRTPAVEVDDDVLGTADVVVVADAATEPHPAVDGRRHHDDGTRPTGGVECLVQTVVT